MAQITPLVFGFAFKLEIVVITAPGLTGTELQVSTSGFVSPGAAGKWVSFPSWYGPLQGDEEGRAKAGHLQAAG